jgi:hypothetical protein
MATMAVFNNIKQYILVGRNILCLLNGMMAKNDKIHYQSDGIILDADPTFTFTHIFTGVSKYGGSLQRF